MVPALIVGALTAWYLGLRAGIICAAAVAGALLVANFVPGLSLAVYALVLAWAGALYFLGPKLSKKSTSLLGSVGGTLAGTVGQATSWAKRILNRSAK